MVELLVDTAVDVLHVSQVWEIACPVHERMMIHAALVESTSDPVLLAVVDAMASFQTTRTGVVDLQKLDATLQSCGDEFWAPIEAVLLHQTEGASQRDNRFSVVDCSLQ